VGADAQARKAALSEFLEAQANTLLDVIRTYTLRMGLIPAGSGYVDARAVALDVMQEVAIEALSHADRFSPDRQPMAWLLGIALNVIRRRKVSQALQFQREVPLESLFAESEGVGMTEGAHGKTPLDEAERQQWASQAIESAPERALEVSEANESALALLAMVPEEDQQVLRLALLDDLNRHELAQALGVSDGAARMRLSRALGRLRAAWFARQQGEQPKQKGNGQNG
jgi:RNA polymerase sigma factor (sigma-70 family)